MNPSVASLICACVIAGLLYLDREKTVRTSRALWLPGLWIAIVGSRSLSEWLGLSSPDNAQLDGSPVDAAAFGFLLAVAIVVLIRRKNATWTLLLANWQADALETAAHDRGLTAAEMVRSLLREFLSQGDQAFAG